MDKTLIKPMALAASVLTGALLLGIETASAQTDKPGTTATRPANTLPDQTSVPNNAPPATTTTTGTAPRDETIKKMNEDAKRKVDTEGK
jgi:hypothetical protein